MWELVFRPIPPLRDGALLGFFPFVVWRDSLKDEDLRTQAKHQQFPDPLANRRRAALHGAFNMFRESNLPPLVRFPDVAKAAVPRVH